MRIFFLRPVEPGTTSKRPTNSSRDENARVGGVDCRPGSRGNLEKEMAFTAALFDMNMNTLITDHSHPGLSAEGCHLLLDALCLWRVWEPVRPSAGKPGCCAKGDLTATARSASELKCALTLLMELENKEAESPHAT